MGFWDTISRRQMLANTAGAVVAARGFGSASAQVVKRIDKFAADLDDVISTTEPILQLGTGFGGGANAEGPVWWHEGGFLLFSSIGNNQRIKYAPGQGTSVRAMFPIGQETLA